MKDFIRPRGRLRPLPLPARVVYSVFLLFTLAGLGLSFWLTELMVGLDMSEAAAYYAGTETPGVAPPQAAEPGAGGPELDFPEDLEEPASAEPMAVRKLLEVTHFHLFSMPLYLMILSHLFMLSRWSDRAKLLWIGLGTLATAGHMAAPWLARSGSQLSLSFYALSGSALAISYLLMSLVPLWEMWAPKGA